MRLVAILIILTSFVAIPFEALAVTISTATTTIDLSICGNALVDVGEQCDVRGGRGLEVAARGGRQCNTSCDY